MGFIAYIVLGLFAGLIAKAIMPGEQGGGWIATILLGVVGASVGGWLGNVIFNVGLENFWSLQTWVLRKKQGLFQALFIFTDLLVFQVNKADTP